MPLVDGNGIKVETNAGTDYVFLCAKPGMFPAATITFECTVGAVVMRGERTRLWFRQPGSIAAHDEILKRSAAPEGSSTK